MHVYTLLSFSLHIGVCKGTTLLETHETFLRLSKDVCENMLRDSSEEKKILAFMWAYVGKQLRSEKCKRFSAKLDSISLRSFH